MFACLLITNETIHTEFSKRIFLFHFCFCCCSGTWSKNKKGILFCLVVFVAKNIFTKQSHRLNIFAQQQQQKGWNSFHENSNKRHFIQDLWSRFKEKDLFRFWLIYVCVFSIFSLSNITSTIYLVLVLFSFPPKKTNHIIF